MSTRTHNQLLIDMLLDLSKKVAKVNGIGGTRDWLVAELSVIISHAQDGPELPAHPSQTEDEHPGYRAVLIAALKMETPDIERLIKDCSMVVPKPLSAPKAVEAVPCPHLVNGSCPLHNLHCQYPNCTQPRTR